MVSKLLKLITHILSMTQNFRDPKKNMKLKLGTLKAQILGKNNFVSISRQGYYGGVIKQCSAKSDLFGPDRKIFSSHTFTSLKC